MTIGIGILGFAHGHINMYCAQWKQNFSDQIKLFAGWDHDAVRAAGARDSFGVAVEASAESLVSRQDIDAVVIGAETSMHADLVEIAARAGKAIILQKPMALTLEQGKRIVAAVEKYKVRFTMAWQMRVDPQNLEMRRLVQEGALGRVFMLRRRHGLATQTWPGFENTWHVNPALNRSMWADDSSHPIDFIYWMMGMPRSVSAEIGTLYSEKVPDDNGIAIFRYAEGAFAEVACSFVCLAGENTTEIVGEKGVVIQNYGDLVSCNTPRAPGAAGLKWFLREPQGWTESAIATPANHGVRINALAPAILEFLQDRRPPIASAREGLDVLRMTLATYVAAERGQRVALNEIQ
jgi:predicted dehydrogenase